VNPEHTISEVVEEVLQRQDKDLAERTGGTLERAMSVTPKTDAARQPEEPAEGARGEQKAAEWQAELARHGPRSATTPGWRATWNGWRARRSGRSTTCCWRSSPA